MRTKNRIKKICFCLFLSLSLLMCGLSVGYADTPDMTSGELPGSAGAGSGEAGTGVDSPAATDTDGDTATDTSGAGSSTSGSQGEAGAASAEGENTNGGEATDESPGEPSSIGEGTTLDPSSNLLGASPIAQPAVSETAINITVPEELVLRNSGKQATVLQPATLTITNGGAQEVTISGISATVSDYTLVQQSSNTDFSDTSQKNLFMSIAYNDVTYDLSDANSIPSISISANDNAEFTFSGNISAVSQKTSASIATLTFTIGAA